MATNLSQVHRGYANLNDNLQMYFETMGDGEPVIFLHQSWWSSFEFEKVIPIVSRQYKVIAPDSLGFGYSPPAPWDWEFEQYCDSFIQFMDFLQISKANFVGQHTGAVIAADLAARYPERVDKLVLGGLPIYEEIIRQEKYRRRRLLGWNGMPYIKSLKPGDVIGYEVGILSKQEDGNHLLEMWQEQKRENPDSSLSGIHKATLANLLHYDKGGADAITILLNYDLEKTLPNVHAPALLIIGTRDCVKPPVFKTIHYAGSLMSGLVKYQAVYGAGIMGWLDYPEEHAQAVLEFLEEPDNYPGTTGYELELLSREKLFLDLENNESGVQSGEI